MDDIYGNLEERLAKTYGLKDENAHTNVGFIPDYHGNIGLFEQTVTELQKEANGKDFYVILNDIPDRKKSLEIGMQLGLQDSASIELGYVAAYLDDENRDLFGYVKTIEMHGGIEKYLQLLSYQYPDVDVDKERSRYKKVYSKYKENNIEAIIDEIKVNKGDEIEKIKSFNSEMWRVLDKTIANKYIDEIAEYIDSFNEKAQKSGMGKINLIVGGDNHTKTSDIKRLQQRTKTTKVHNVNDISGAIVLGKGDDSFRFQYMANVTGVFQHIDSFIGLTEEEMFYEYPHMISPSFNNNTPVKYRDKLNPEAAFTSFDLYRITNGRKDMEKLDHLFMHKEPEYDIGVMGFENKQNPYGHLDDIGALWAVYNLLKKDKDGFGKVTSGHLHSAKNKKNLEMLLDKSRAAAQIVSKQNRKIVGDMNDYRTKDFNVEEIFLSMQEKYEQLVKKYDLNNLIQDRIADDYEDSAAA